MSKRAVLIGICYYGTENQLDGCINDTLDMKTYLHARGYKINVLTDKVMVSVPTISTQAPTRKNIISALTAAVAKTRPGDTLFVHYSGHGSQMASSTEADGLDECICPVDFSTTGFIQDDLLKQILVDKLPHGARLRAVFDSCHSGSILDLPYRWQLNSWANDDPHKCTADVLVISGCKDEQTSADAFINGRNNGALTWAVLCVLGEIDHSRLMATWKDFISGVRGKLIDGSYEQTPQISIASKDLLLHPVDL